MSHFDTIIIGAGAAGLMCGAVAGAQGRSVLILDHAAKPAEKIRISGGGRCNFTNLYSTPKNFISQNPHFCKSALSRYRPQDFIDLVESHGISWHEKTKGQLFCDGRSQAIIDMLLCECDQVGCELRLSTEVLDIRKGEGGFLVTTDRQSLTSESVVIATGGPSIPKMGASGFAYKVATQFGLGLVETVPALVPLTFTDGLKDLFKDLSGVSIDVRVSCNGMQFDEALLFTHRGLSGPAILQISSYWSPGDDLTVNFAPGTDMFEVLKQARTDHPKQHPKTVLSNNLPQRFVAHILAPFSHERLADMSDKVLRNIALQINALFVRPAGTEGYRTAEVTKGGVDTKGLSSKTMEARAVPGLYFIGECVDVTGHLGGHNFQWAWASGVAAGQVA